MRSERDVGSKVKYEVTVSVPVRSLSLLGTEEVLRHVPGAEALLPSGAWWSSEPEASPSSWALTAGRYLCCSLS